MITAQVYIWPEHGDVDYFFFEISAKGADCRLDQNKRGDSNDAKQ